MKDVDLEIKKRLLIMLAVSSLFTKLLFQSTELILTESIIIDKDIVYNKNILLTNLLNNNIMDSNNRREKKVIMKNSFSFNDMIQFGMFLLVLLTFVHGM